MNITDDDYNSYDTKEKDFHCVFSMLWYYLFGLQIVHKGIGKLKRGMIRRRKRREILDQNLSICQCSYFYVYMCLCGPWNYKRTNVLEAFTTFPFLYIVEKTFLYLYITVRILVGSRRLFPHIFHPFVVSLFFLKGKR